MSATPLRDKVQNGLDEARMLILGAQVLLGFQFRSVFEQGFDKLPRATQHLKLAGLALLFLDLGLILAPAAFHRIVEQGRDTDRLHWFVSRVMEVALLPLALAMGIEVFAATEKVAGAPAGWAGAALAVLTALFFWYGLEWILGMKSRMNPGGPEMKEQGDEQGPETTLGDRIKHVLTEARVVLPGAQALLGFQFATMLMENFDELPESSKYIHLGSLAAIMLTIILLMTPAAYHRIVERGEDSERFHAFASRIVLAAMATLALGMTTDVFVVLRKVIGSAPIAAVLSASALVVLYAVWFGLMIVIRVRRGAGS